MTLSDFLDRINRAETIDFQETIAIIQQYYHYQPTEFSNGLIEPLVNPAGKNEGSCKIFAFAQLHNLTLAQTLSLFGKYYTEDVLAHPQGTDHLNIRNFMRDGWAGIKFTAPALQAIA